VLSGEVVEELVLSGLWVFMLLGVLFFQVHHQPHHPQPESITLAVTKLASTFLGGLLREVSVDFIV
jgi:hypothetical protein